MDTLVGRWQVTEEIDRPSFGGGGLVIFEGAGWNQTGEKMLEARVVPAVGEEGLWNPGP